MSSILGPVVSLNQTLTTTFLPTLPLPMLVVVHAARVSLAYRSIKSVVQTKNDIISGKDQKSSKDSWGYDLAGFLIMGWGGSILSAFLLNTTPVQFLSPLPLLTFALVHIYLGILLKVLPLSSSNSLLWLDTLLPIMDGATRTGAIISSVTLTRKTLHGDNFFFTLLIGTISACGGGQLASTLSVFNSQKDGWKFSTPAFVNSKNFLQGIDVYAALAGTLTWTVLTASSSEYQKDSLVLLAKRYGLDMASVPRVSTEEAQAITTVVIAAFFAYKAVVTHWIVKSPKSQGKRLAVENAKQQTRTAKGKK
ncbi:unnamed protein product [Sympodiomycopsis kandeliae]